MSVKMKTNRMDVLTVTICLTFLPVMISASGRNGRERARRMVCLANLQQLTSAWNMYADDNDDRIVNGAPLGTSGMAMPGTGLHKNEIPWVGRCYHDNYPVGEQLSEQTQTNAIMDGAMWPYLHELRIYRCPNGFKGEMLNYAAMDGINGLPRAGTTANPHIFLKKRADITGSLALRMVYIDEGWATPSSFAVHYTTEAWWDDPPMRHSDGTTLSFVDGHTEYHQWQGVETIQFGRQQVQTHTSTCPCNTDEGKMDLHYIQKGCWGKLGYTPENL